MEAYQKEFIELAIEHQALKFGEFTLKSGRKSPYFFNMGLLSSGASLKKIGECYAKAIEQAQINFTQLFGPAYKGIPLASSTAVAFAQLWQKDIPFSFDRKEVKDHGEGGMIVGAPLSGQVLIIDDVMTAGTAVRHSIDLIKKSKANLAGVIVALDRQEKGPDDLSAVQAINQAEQVPVISIINLQHLIDYMQARQQLSEDEMSRLLAYQQAYGV